MGWWSRPIAFEFGMNAKIEPAPSTQKPALKKGTSFEMGIVCIQRPAIDDRKWVRVVVMAAQDRTWDSGWTWDPGAWELQIPAS